MRHRTEYMRAYQAKNRDKLNAYSRAYHAKKFPPKPKVVKHPIQARVASNMRRRLNLSLKHTGTLKNNSTMNYVGCSKEELIKHLELQFTEGMSWDNYGEWHIDHIIPLSSFDLTKEENLYKSMNYGNLQPLWKADNLKKSNKLSTPGDNKHGILDLSSCVLNYY